MNEAQRERGDHGLCNRVWIIETGGDAGGRSQPSDLTTGGVSAHFLDNEASEYRDLKDSKTVNSLCKSVG